VSNPIGNASDIIKDKIKEAGIKQVHLAKKLGISPQHLNKILAKNQDRSQYLPKIAEILGLDAISAGLNNITAIPILSEKILKSLAKGSISFEELEQTTIQSWPSTIQEDYYFFGYRLVENINSQLFRNDLLIFSSSLPCDMSGRIGLAFIEDKGLIFIGTLKYNRKTITIYNERDCFEFKAADQLIGIAVHLERNIEEGLK
jgi:transcriptional regulator with XRE-family HTH domain